MTVPTWSQLLDPPPFPHVAWSHLLLQEDVSNAASRFSAAWLSNLVVCPGFQKVFFCPPLPKVLGDLLLESEFFVRRLVEVGSGPVGMVVRRPPCRKWAGVKASGPSSLLGGVS